MYVACVCHVCVLYVSCTCHVFVMCLCDAPVCTYARSAYCTQRGSQDSRCARSARCSRLKCALRRPAVIQLLPSDISRPSASPRWPPCVRVPICQRMMRPSQWCRPAAGSVGRRRVAASTRRRRRRQRRLLPAALHRPATHMAEMFPGLVAPWTAGLLGQWPACTNRTREPRLGAILAGMPRRL